MIKTRANPVYCGIDTTDLAWAAKLIQTIAGGPKPAVGGIKITETAWDVPVVIALASSLRDKTVPNSLISFGEIGLTGEVRPVAYGEERLKEAQKQGFKVAVVPRENAPRKPLQGLEVIAVARVGEALEAAFGRAS